MAKAKKTDKKYKLLSDSPACFGGRRDLLGVTPTAFVLANAAIQADCPLTIGIFGKWGTGKTSLMRFIQREVEKSGEAVTVWFNAWQFEKEEHLIIPLLATIDKALENATDSLPSKMKKWLSTWRKAINAFACGIELKGTAGIPLLAKIEAGIFPEKMYAYFKQQIEDSVFARSLYFDAYEELSKCRDEADIPRIVVFVDDLDRCFPNKAVELLEGIKLVLHQPGFSFFLGVDDAIIRAFIKTKYEKDFGIEGFHFEEYLDKIVQVKIPVMERDDGEVKKYILKLLGEAGIFTDVSTADLVPMIMECCSSNPRTIVGLMNRIIVNYRICEQEIEIKGTGEKVDAIALLIHTVTKEEKYKDFPEALGNSVRIDDEGGTEEIGAFLAKKLENYNHINHSGWISEVKKSLEGDQPGFFDIAMECLADNRSLCRVLRHKAGLEWLSSLKVRKRAGKYSQRTLEQAEVEAVDEKPRMPDKLGKGGYLEELRLDRMVHIHGEMCKFTMGSDSGEKNEEPPHKVTLSEYRISKYPITQAQYLKIMGENPSSFMGEKHPIETVSWRDAYQFCEKLTEHEKKARRLPDGLKYRLPTEAEWECACRAGSSTEYCFGDYEEALEKYVWFNMNSRGETHPVGLKLPNDWGIFDMHGNVWEWCLDWFDEGFYSKCGDPCKDPVKDKKGSERVVRGGSWFNVSWSCCAASRNSGPPSDRDNCVGFRVVVSGISGMDF